MNIAIVGPGAIGTLTAYFLLKSEKNVMLIDKDEKSAAAFAASGITVTTLENRHAHIDPRVMTFEQARAQSFDLLIIAVKSYDTQAVAKKIKALAGKDTFVLSLQNGLGNLETLEETVDAERLLGAFTQHAAYMVSAHELKHTGAGDTEIGFFRNKKPGSDLARRKFLNSLIKLFNAAGMNAKYTDDLRSALWSKLIVNVGINAVSAVTRLPNGELVCHEWTRRIMHDAVMEAVRVAKRKKIPLHYADPIKKVESVARDTADNISSMLQDVLRKRATEIDYLNGALMTEAEGYNIEVPVNRMLTHLVKAIESSYGAQCDRFPGEKAAGEHRS